MRWGATTMFYRELPVIDAVQRIARAGYDAVEVWAEHLWESGADAKEVGAVARGEGAALSVHAAIRDINITSNNAGIRRESMTQMRASMEAAVAMEAEVVVMHPGRFSSTHDLAEEHWERLRESLMQIDAWAAEVGARIAVELMEQRPREFFMMPEDGRRMAEWGLKNCGLTVDIAHFNTNGDPVVLIGGCDPADIWHVHLSDNRPQQVHAPLGGGTIDLAAALGALPAGYAGLVSLEGYQRGRGDELIAANLDYLRRMEAAA